MRTAVFLFLFSLGLAGQDFRIPAAIDKLAARATESVDVTLDSSMLQMAGRFLSDKKADEAEAKRLIGGLKGIYVRSFEFASPGQYSESDVESVRSQLRAPLWSRVVGVRSKRDGENAEVFFKTENGKVTGIAVIAAEPRELTIVNIVGTVDPEQLGKLGGQFGIPKVEIAPRKAEKE